MKVKDARFVISNTDIKKCPKPDKPEYAFIGRSNVGKSSLINMLTGNSNLAKISGTPGKTRLINHYIVNNEWYLVDLPGYGYAKISKADRKLWEQFIRNYIINRPNLYCICLLIDSRHEPQKLDLEFMQWLGENSIPFIIIFTKTDKLNKTEFSIFKENYCNKLIETWEVHPQMFVSSSETSLGKEEILNFIEDINKGQ